jgi:signal transduction histidine kinase
VFKGAGLGLANAALFVKMHGGRITVEDAVPHGARFMIELPAVPDMETMAGRNLGALDLK